MMRTIQRAACLLLLSFAVACGDREQPAGHVDGDATARKPIGPPAGVAAWALPDSAFKIQWEPFTVPGFAPGATQKVQVRLKNASDTRWPDPPTADPKLKQGAFAVRLSYRWLRPDGDVALTGYNARVDLPKPLEPGESAVLPIDVVAPPDGGKYQLQFDLVQELVAWFADKGAATSIQPVEVRRSE